MIGIVTSPGPFDAGTAMADCLAAVDASVVSVVRSIRASMNTSAPLQQTTLLRGQDHITETVGGLRFGIGIETFFQTNSAQAEALVSLVLELAGEVTRALVIDLYCGVGMFTLALAAAAPRRWHRVVGKFCRGGTSQCSEQRLWRSLFFAGDARTVLPQCWRSRNPTCRVLDPPRAGAGERSCGELPAPRPSESSMYRAIPPRWRAISSSFCPSATVSLWCNRWICSRKPITWRPWSRSIATLFRPPRFRRLRMSRSEDPRVVKPARNPTRYKI